MPTDVQINKEKETNESLEQSLEKTSDAIVLVTLRNQQIVAAMKLTKELIDELAGHAYQRSTEFQVKFDDLKKQINETKL